MINWKLRLKNKVFWLTAIPTSLLLVEQVCAIFGVAVDLANLGTQLTAVVGTVFALLALLGVAVDMTTEGIGDSQRALGYEEPYSDEPKF